MSKSVFKIFARTPAAPAATAPAEPAAAAPPAAPAAAAAAVAIVATPLSMETLHRRNVELAADLTAASTQLAAAVAQIGALTARLDAVEAMELDLGAPDFQAALQAALGGDAVRAVAASTATEILASAGAAPSQIPASSGAPGHGQPSTRAEAQAEYERLGREKGTAAARRFRLEHSDLFAA